MTFSQNVPNTLQTEIQNLWGVHTTKQHDRYLGLPAVTGKSRKRAFGKIKSHLWKKLLCWKEKLLFQEGKEVLQPSQITPRVASNSLDFFTRSQKANVEVFEGQKRDEQKIHWRNQKKICMPKRNGGLNFKNLMDFNLALLTKQRQNILTKTDSLLHQAFFKAKYFSHGHLFYPKLGSNPSYAWWGIREIILWIQQGSIWRIGDGSSVKVWTDKWIPRQPTLPNNLPSYTVDPEMQVSELIVNGQWDKAKLVEMFPLNQVSNILTIAIIPPKQSNKLIWALEKNGMFSVKNTYLNDPLLTIRRDLTCKQTQMLMESRVESKSFKQS